MDNMPASDTTSRPCVFLFSLDKIHFFDEMYARLIDALSSKATVKEALEPTTALTLLSTITPTAILITDPGITKPLNSAVLDQVISYVRRGGTAILACHFSGFISVPDLNHFFRSRWDLPWQVGQYHRETVHLSSHMLQMLLPSLPAEYSQKAVFLKNVAPEASLYLPPPPEDDDDDDDDDDDVPIPVSHEPETPVAFAAVGEGWLGYVGDVNTEEGSESVVLAMCKLLQ